MVMKAMKRTEKRKKVKVMVAVAVKNMNIIMNIIMRNRHFKYQESRFCK